MSNLTDQSLDPQLEKKKPGRPKKIQTGDVMVPKEPKLKKKKISDKEFKKKVKAIGGHTEPKVEIDWEQFEKLCGYQCTQEEISDFFRIEEEQLIQLAAKKYKKPFTKIYKIFSAPGLCSLRRSQFLIAKNNSQMAMWLGKIYLNQIDPAHSKTEETIDRLSSILEQIDEETKRIMAQKDDLHGSFF